MNSIGAKGYPVAVNFTRDRSSAEQVVQQIRALGARATAVQGDVADEAQVERLFVTAERELGRIEGLVNNAGITGETGLLETLGAATIAEVLAVNVIGTILCAREAVRRMSTKNGGAGGAIVNISSLAARTGGSGEYVHYAASKGAVNSFTIGLAKEVATEGIRVNCVAPGLIETEIHSPGRLDRIRPSIPMQRIGTPQEVAEAVVWMLSRAASYTTGSILEVGGGR